MKNKIFLIDGSGFIFRAFFSVSRMTRNDGTPVNAVFGFCNMIQKIAANSEISHICIVFDSGSKTFRNDIYPKYKQHRPELPEDLAPQFSIIKDSCDAFNLYKIEQQGFEADDIIATLASDAEEMGLDVNIISSDKDLMQLVNDNIHIFDPMKNKIIDVEGVVEKFGVTPDKVIEVQALAGDSSDNIPGVKGVGVKTAAELINKYGSIENLYENIEDIKQPKRKEKLIEDKENAFISKRLVTLKQDMKLDYHIDEMMVKKYEPKILAEFFNKQNFKSLIKRNNLEEYIESTNDTEVVGSSLNNNFEYKLPGKCEYICINDYENLKNIIDKSLLKQVVSIDTETNGLSVVDSEIVGISICFEDDISYYIPFGHKCIQQTNDLLLLPTDDDDNDNLNIDAVNNQISKDKVVEQINILLGDASVKKVFHNAKFDVSMFINNGFVEPASVEDTMLMSYVVNAGKHGHSMDYLASKYFDHECIAFKSLVGTGKKQITFDYVPIDLATNYAAEDTFVTYHLYFVLRSQMINENMFYVYEEVEKKLINVISNMELNGVHIDVAKLGEYGGEFSSQSSLIEQKIFELAGQEFNILSSKQLSEILFEKLELPNGKKNKSGGYSTNVDILEDLASEYEIAKLVLEYRGLMKLQSTYVDGLIKEISKNTGKIHTSFNVVGTQTGRLSSTDPNLQNIPTRTQNGQKIRECFIAGNGNVLLSLDYSQVELRIMAHMANEKSMIDGYNNGIDIHMNTAIEVFDADPNNVSKEDRRKAKIVNFGIIYGVSAFGLAKQIGCTNGEASSIIKKYFEKYPNVQNYMENQKNIVKTNGFVKTVLGRKINLPGVFSTRGIEISHANRQAINAPVQGTSADIIKVAMIDIYDKYKQNNNIKMILQIHDELIFEVKKEFADEYAKDIQQIMEHSFKKHMDFMVPFDVDFEHNDNWKLI